MILERYVKQPSETKDYDIDYTPWLAPMADTIQHATATVTCLNNPNDISLLASPVEFTPTSVKVWVSGGTNRNRYKVDIRVTTVGGRIDESELLFSVREF